MGISFMHSFIAITTIIIITGGWLYLLSWKPLCNPEN